MLRAEEKGKRAGDCLLDDFDASFPLCGEVAKPFQGQREEKTSHETESR